MDDTPEHVKAKQLEIWLSKTPEERLRQTLLDNDAMFKFWNSFKMDQPKSSDETNVNTSASPQDSQ